MRRMEIKSFGVVWLLSIIIGSLLGSSVNAYWWTDNPPGGGSHDDAPDMDLIDGVVHFYIADDIPDIAVFNLITGGALNNPEEIALDPAKDYCVWSIDFDLKANLSVQNPPNGNRVEVHSYLYKWQNNDWDMIDSDWMACANQNPGSSESEDGCLHLYDGNGYQIGDEYYIAFCYVAYILDGAFWDLVTPYPWDSPPPLIVWKTGYYEIV